MVRAGNYMHIALECADLASFLFAHCLEEGIRSFEVTEEAESEWVETIVRKYREMPPSSYMSLDYLKSCTPSYLNNEGKPLELDPRDASFAGTPREFFSILRRWRESGALDGLELSR
jgi:cyclohexanone monooxygenase